MLKHFRKEPKDPLNGRHISDILSVLPDQFKGDSLTISDLRAALHGRIYGIFLIVLALPNVIPVPAPGLSAILGAPLLLLTFQMALGEKHPWLPQFVENRTIRSAHLRLICEKVVPYLRRWERISVPRWFFLVQPPAHRVIAFVCMVLSLLIMLPVPFGNAMPALAICFFAIALLQRDGVFTLIGALIGFFAVFLIMASLGAVVLALQKFLGL